jgi:DNA-binding response OmpR family regulator
MLDTLRDVLEALGYAASTAATGEQAIAAMVTVQPHVVFLDLGMPGISGRAWRR